MISFTEVEMVIGVIIAIFAVSATCWSGVKAIREAISPLSNLFETSKENAHDISQLKQDVAALKQKSTDYDDYFRKDKKALEKDREELDDLKKATVLLLQAVSELIEHEIHGGHEEELKQTNDKIDDYLRNRLV